MTKKATTNIRVIFGISFLVLLISSVTSYLSVTKLLDSEKMVDHTYQVIEKLDSLLSKMKDAETGYRGYLLTGNEVFLEPFKGSQQAVMNAFRSAQLLTADNPSQQQTFPQLKALIDQKFKISNQWIKERKTNTVISSSAMLEGKAIMDQVREVIKTMKDRELALMTQRQTKASKFVLYTPMVITISAIFAILITLIFYFRIQRDIKNNEQLHQELVKVEQDRNRQIDIIEGMAKKVASGNYETRINFDELHENGDEMAD